MVIDLPYIDIMIYPSFRFYKKDSSLANSHSLDINLRQMKIIEGFQ